jgi:competence protein CoiA
VLTAKSKTADYVEASAGAREEAYFCRGCDESVIFKRGRIRIPYFSHRAGSQCAYGATMSLEHLTAQQVLADGIRSRGAHAELEVPMASLVGQDRRIDVLAWPAAKPNARIALEVQKSDITVELIDARTQCYLEAGIAPLWVRLYDFSKWEKPGLLKGRNTIWIDRHFVRSWERWAYEHLGGELWFMDSKSFALWRGTFLDAHSYKEQTSWFSSGGEEQSAGGYWQGISQWVELELEGPYRATDLRLKRFKARGPDKKLRVAATFLAPGEEEAPAETRIRVRFLADHPSFTRREVQVKLGDGWIAASVQPAPEGWRDFGIA